jgi:hypothetical protein
MASNREKMEPPCSLTQLFDSIANHPPGHNMHDSAVAEIARRTFVSDQKVAEAQIAAAETQIVSAKFAKESLSVLRRTARWTALAALAAAISAGVAAWSTFIRGH